MNESRATGEDAAECRDEKKAEQYFELLLSEKEYTDRQIADNLQANLKVLGTVFTVIVAVLGWLFSTAPSAYLSPLLADRDTSSNRIGRWRASWTNRRPW